MTTGTWRHSSLLAALATATIGFFGCGDDQTVQSDAPVVHPDAPSDDAPLGSASLSVTPLTSSFGSVVVASSGTAATFTVTNTGTGTSGAISATLMGAAAG